LKEIQERYEGFQRGTRAVMQRADDIVEGQSDTAAIHGVVADVVRAPELLEVAVEAALGDRLGGVLVSEPEVGLAAIGFLKQRSGGRSAFVPLAGPVLPSPVSAPSVRDARQAPAGAGEAVGADDGHVAWSAPVPTAMTGTGDAGHADDTRAAGSAPVPAAMTGTGDAGHADDTRAAGSAPAPAAMSGTEEAARAD